MRTEEIILTKH